MESFPKSQNLHFWVNLPFKHKSLVTESSHESLTEYHVLLEIKQELFCVPQFHNTLVKVQLKSASLLAGCFKDNIYLQSLYNKLHFNFNLNNIKL